MKLHRFRHKSYRDGIQPHTQALLHRQRGVFFLLALLLIGLVIAFAPSRGDVTHVDSLAVPYALAPRVSAQDSPLSPSLSVALETKASTARRAKPAISNPALSDQRNLMRVAAVITGVLLMTVIVWRQR